MKFFFIWAILFSHVNSLKILVYQTVVSTSHLYFSQAIIDSLVEKGHVVDKIIMEWNILNKNITDKSRNTVKFLMPYTTWGKHTFIDDPLSPNAGIQFDDELVLEARKIMCKLLLDEQSYIVSLMNEKYDVGLTSIYDSCGFGLFHVLGIKSTAMFSATHLSDVVVWSLGIPIPPSYVSDWLNWHGIGEKMNFFNRLYNIVHLSRLAWKLEHLNNGEQELFEKNYPDFPRLTKLLQNVCYIFINSLDILDISRPVSGKIKYIGGIGVKPPKKLDPLFDKVLSQAKKGVVLFSFGSVVKSTSIPGKVKKDFMNVFKKFDDYIFLWKYDDIEENGVFVKNYPNIFAVKWLPQTDLLFDPRVKAFITHGGLNSYLEAAHGGVPLVTMPLFTDQSYNANAGIFAGMAVLLRKDNISKESIDYTLKQVLFNPRYYQTAQEISKIISRSPLKPQEILVKHVELAARFPNISAYLQLESTEQDIFTYFCIDVWLFLFTVLLFSIYIPIVMYRRIYLMLTKNRKIKIS